MSGSKVFGASLIVLGTAIQFVYVFWVALQLVSSPVHDWTLSRKRDEACHGRGGHDGQLVDDDHYG